MNLPGLRCGTSGRTVNVINHRIVSPNGLLIFPSACHTSRASYIWHSSYRSTAIVSADVSNLSSLDNTATMNIETITMAEAIAPLRACDGYSSSGASGITKPTISRISRSLDLNRNARTLLRRAIFSRPKSRSIAVKSFNAKSHDGSPDTYVRS